MKQRYDEPMKKIYSFEEAVKIAGAMQISYKVISKIILHNWNSVFLGHGKYQFLLLLVCGCSLMGVVVENVNIGFVVPYARCDLRFSASEQGALNAVGYVGIVISSHCWGFLADTWGRRKVLRMALFGSFTCAVLSAFSISTIMLIVTRLFVGIWCVCNQIICN